MRLHFVKVMFTLLVACVAISDDVTPANSDPLAEINSDVEGGFEIDPAEIEEAPPGKETPELEVAGDKTVDELIHSPDGANGEALLGDFDSDGVLDLDKDLGLLANQFGVDEPDLRFDLNKDGDVNKKDTRYWIKRLRRIPVGDANLDNQANTRDISVAFQSGIFNTKQPATWSTGDWNGDGFFDQSDMDFVMESGDYERSASSRQSATASPVPEPIALSLVGMGLVFLLLAYTAVQGQKKSVQP